MRNLCRCGYGNLAVAVLIRKGNRQFNMAVLYTLGIIRLIHQNKSLFFHSFIKAFITQGERCMFQNIIRHIVMHSHGSLRHGICHIHQCRVFLIMYFHKSCCLNSCNLIFCNDSCHIIPIITHPLIQKAPVLNILVRRLHRPRMSRCTKINLWHIKTGNNLYNPRHF